MPITLDSTDKKILRALLGNARLTNSQLAENVGLSPSPCWQRVRKLEKEGYITGYAANLDNKLLGITDVVILEITLDRHHERSVNDFGTTMAAIPEVLEVYVTSGTYDYFLKVAVNGTAGYERFLTEKLYKVPGISQMRSSFTLKCLKNVQSYVG
jgi:Lrp/AsnC family transcriptional regulator, leucine-responsive regulatory protein